MSEEKTYRINVRHFERLEAEIAQLNKRASKLRVTPVVLNVLREESVTGKNDLGIEHTATFKIVTVIGETPKLAGWKLVAAIEHQASGENLISCVPGETVPVSYRTTGIQCDHCKTNRRRSEVFVMQHDDGHHVQIGRNCIADFLGGKSPEGILRWAEWALNIEQVMNKGEESEAFGGGRYGERTYNTDEYLKLTAVVIRRLGWVSRSTVEKLGPESGLKATAEIVGWLMTPSYSAGDRQEKKEFIEKNQLEVREQDSKLVSDALAWGKALPTDVGDYVYNLGVACRLGFVQQKTAGLMASLISAYQRHLDREAELNMQRSEKKDRKHLGVVGERTGFAQVTLKTVLSFEDNFGVKTLLRFEDAEGSILIWWKSGDTTMEEGNVYDITGTVKKHDDYKGTPQTVLQRVAEGLPKPKKVKKMAGA